MTFNTGDDPRRWDPAKAREGIKKPLDMTKYVLPEEDGAPQTLKDMRHVNLNPKKYDQTGGQRTCRRLQEKKVLEFLKLLDELEEKHRDSKIGVSAAGEVDVGSEKAEGLIDQLLKELEV